MEGEGEAKGKQPPVFCVSLDAHSATVNCIRFSPSGEILASGSDDHRIFLWRRNEQRTSPDWTFASVQNRNEITHRMMDGHKSDIYSLSWSPNGLYLASGSTDNTICLWNVRKNKRVNGFDKVHNHYVQGVAWDPRDRYVMSQSCDRTVRVYARNKALKTLCHDVIESNTTMTATTTNTTITKKRSSSQEEEEEGEGEKSTTNNNSKVEQPIQKRAKRWNGDEIKPLYRIFKIQENIQVEKEKIMVTEEKMEVVDSAEITTKIKKTHLFLDETTPSFFRRLDFTCDGSFAIVCLFS